ncbi:unnamed protein product [Paramecium pentaurelia]|uniref:Uncharacterized protein n=1 Tax=Paramecium pentaurelia TaxID=43138 RepID=A0A8S1SRA2_9CILI|nr:unnamed protein product [Paramecium pentaurelia]
MAFLQKQQMLKSIIFIQKHQLFDIEQMQSAQSKRILTKQSPQSIKSNKVQFSFQQKNVKLININVKTKLRSCSFPSSLNPLKYIEIKGINKKQSILNTQSSLGSQKQLRKPRPMILSEKDIQKQQNKEQFKQRRRSCECQFCGPLSRFQKQCMNHEFRIQHIEKERESPMHKFQRSIRKHQIYVMAPYLFAIEIPTESLEQSIVRKNTFKIEKKNTQLLDVIKQEDVLQINSSKILDSTPTKKPSFFESFLVKQKEIINSEKSKLINKQFSSLSYHLLSRNAYKYIKPFKTQLPQIQTQQYKQEPALSTERSSQKKSEKIIKELYIKPFIHKYPSRLRLTTLPDLIPNNFL